MKRRFSAIIILCIMAMLLWWASYSMIVQSPETYKVSAVLTDSEADRWFAVKEGMKQAASDFGMDLNFAQVKQYPTTSDEWDIINQEIDAGANAVIVEPIGKNLLEKEDFQNNQHIVLLDSDVEPEGVYDCVHADDEAIGRLLFDKIYEKYGEELKYKKIGVVAGEANRLAMNQRLKGFYSGLFEHNLKPGWTMGLGRTLEQHLRWQMKNARPDILVSLGNAETEIAVDLIVSRGIEDSVEIYGEGYSEKTVYYLERGTIDCLVLPNEFAMGYLAVEKAAESLSNANVSKVINGKIEEESATIDLHSVRTEELYQEENQKILFPHIR